MDIRTGHLDHPDVIALLRGHLHALAQLTPTDHMHALGLERLRGADITFWSAWDGDEVLGCAALRQLDARHGELKSMRTATRHLRRGVAAALLEHVIGEARRRRYSRLSLETGTAGGFEPAHRLYARAGFVRCGPFAHYADDPHSEFMTLALPVSSADAHR